MAQMAHTNIRPTIHTDMRKFNDTGLREYTVPDATLAGTAVAGGVLESEIVTGGQTILIDLLEAVWVPAGTQFNAQRQAIINGLDSNKAEAHGWDVDLKGAMAVTTVVRTSATRVTVTLPAAATYAITADEVVTCTIPKAAIQGGQQDVVAGSFTITNE
jgi:hypothetical protein